MLVDSQPGWIELLPALPADWHAGRIEGIRARGNVEIRALEWSRAKFAATLRSIVDQTIEVRLPGDHKLRRLELKAGRDSSINGARKRSAISLGLKFSAECTRHTRLQYARDATKAHARPMLRACC